MPVYGHSVTEAKRIKGQEFDVLSKKVNKDGQVVSDDKQNGSHYGTTALGKGGVLDSVAQRRIEDIDLEKEKILLEAKDFLGEYMDYTGNNLFRAIDQYDDKSKSQLEKRMVEDFKDLRDMGVEDGFSLIADEYYGWKHIGGMKNLFDREDEPTDEELLKCEKILKGILRMRINYVERMTSIMSKMLHSNYKMLGLSEEQAKVYIDNLTSGTNDSVKAAGEVKDLIKANSDKFMTNNGESIDLTPLGYGVILGPTKGYELNLVGTDGTNKDGMLSLIQQAMRYDAVVIAHGGDNSRLSNTHISLTEWEDVIEMLRYEAKKSKTKTLNKISETENIPVSDLSILDIHTQMTEKVSEYIKNETIKIVSNAKNAGDTADKLDEFIFNLAIKVVSNADFVKRKIKEASIKANKEELVLLKKYVQECITIMSDNLFMSMLKVAYSSIKHNVENYWLCQPTKTLQAGPFEDVNELVRQLIKEGYKKIIINDCNPGGHKIADDIMKTKGILITHSDFSNFVESSIDVNDEDLRMISEAEQSLKEFAESYDIDYNNDEYLEECCQWYLENYEMIHEGERFDKLKEFFKRILAGIIGFIKKLFSLVKKALGKLKTLFFGTKEEPKDTQTKFQKPITTKLIDVKNKKIVEVTSENREGLNKDASVMCSQIASVIKDFNQKQQNSLKRMERDIDELSRKESNVHKESMVFDMDEYMSLYEFFGGDFLESMEFIAEFEAPGYQPSEDEEETTYDMDDEGEETPEVPAPATEEPAEDEGDDEYSMDDEGDAEPTNEPETPEEPAEPEEGEDEYSMDDEGETPEEPTQEETPEGEEPTEGEGDDNYEIPDDEGGEGDDEYSMDDEGDSSEGDAAAADTPEEPDGSNPITDKLKELESIAFDNLSDADKQIKSKELKELFITVYKKCGSISDLLTDVKRDEETIQIVEYISNTLIDLRQYVEDYINKVFDNKSYIENLTQLQKYIMIFTTINKVFEQINTENNK